MSFWHRFHKVFQRVFSMTPEDIENRNIRYQIAWLVKHHPHSPEAADGMADFFREYLKLRNGTVLLGESCYPSDSHCTIRLIMPGESTLTVFDNKWIEMGPWQQEIPNLLQEEINRIDRGELPTRAMAIQQQHDQHLQRVASKFGSP